MKPIKLFIIFFLLLSLFVKAQEPCKTILLKDGHRYNGVIIAISSRVIKFENCDKENKPITVVYRRDVENDYQYTELKEKIRIQRFAKKKIPFDTIKSLHIGIIPYQFLTRSSATYVRLDFKNSSLEYRPSYTYATNYGPNVHFTLPFYDNFYFQGINNSLICTQQPVEELKLA